jgi:O-antigen ligase
MGNARPSSTEVAFIKLAILLSTGAFDVVLITDQDSSGTGNPLLQAAWAGIALVSFILLFRERRSAKTWLSDWVLWAFVFVPLLSTLWSIDHLVTLRRSLNLAATVALGLYIGLRYPLRVQLRILSSVLSIAAFASIAAVILLPDVGIMQDIGVEGAWRGIFPHRNALGQMMVLNCLALLSLYSGRRKTFAVYGTLLLSVALILFSGSRSALALLLVILSAAYMFRGGIKRIRKWVLIFATLLVISVLAHVELDDVFALIGRDATLTGRTDLWAAVGMMILRAPLLGHGYAAFWTESNPDRDVIWKFVGWQPNHSHNGFLEVLLGVGAIGLLVLLCTLGAMFVRAWKHFEIRRNSVAAFPLLFLLAMVISNLDETNFLQSNNIFTILTIAVATSIHLYRHSRKRPAFVTPRKDAAMGRGTSHGIAGAD